MRDMSSRTFRLRDLFRLFGKLVVISISFEVESKGEKEKC